MQILMWVRTVLFVGAFAVVMTAWYEHEENTRRLNVLIARVCASAADPKAQDECELNLRLQAEGVELSGSVEVTGAVEAVAPQR